MSCRWSKADGLSTISWRKGKASWGRLYSCSSAGRRGISSRTSREGQEKTQPCVWDRQHPQHRPHTHRAGSHGPSYTGRPRPLPHLPADSPQGRRCPLSPRCLRAQGERNQLTRLGHTVGPTSRALPQRARQRPSQMAQLPTAVAFPAPAVGVTGVNCPSATPWGSACFAWGLQQVQSPPFGINWYIYPVNRGH